MKTTLSAILISGLVMFGVGSAVAVETAPAVSIEKQMRDLKKMAGSGEISAKEFNKRIAALKASAQQSAEAAKK
jgi:prefoldin subunit 5